ncbi:MAG TPA: ribose-5-phosphate isomerase RpiA [Candidatus Methylomirabilis sp.]|nr:ribose-5-phosphate isomerase RpiA [Candidatus Methylomirabilis sp.]
MASVNAKERAAEYGASLVRSGMVLGLGSGTTSTLAVQAIGRRIREGGLRDVRGVPSSSAIAAVAKESGVPLTTLDEHPVLDLNLDGADEADPDLNLIKGLGGALLWEKIVATASRQVVILVDDSKLVTRLGQKAPLPVEVVPFGWRTHLAFVESLGGKPQLRTGPDGKPFVTDEGNYILHCRFEAIPDPAGLEARLLTRAGVVGTGLFLGIAHQVIIGRPSGVEVRSRH